MIGGERARCSQRHAKVRRMHEQRLCLMLVSFSQFHSASRRVCRGNALVGKTPHRFPTLKIKRSISFDNCNLFQVDFQATGQTL
jgi:hypothetical protein